MNTASHKQIDYANPRADQVCLQDIALSLSQTCRFTGQCTPFYSVGQHSLLLSYMVPPALALQALMHDAAEAYCHDINTHLKALLPDYRAIYDRVEQVVFERFGLPWPLAEHVHQADKLLGAMEYDALMLRTVQLDRVFLVHADQPVRNGGWIVNGVMMSRMPEVETNFEHRFFELGGVV